MALSSCSRHKVIQMERKPQLNAITGSRLEYRERILQLREVP